MIQPDLHDHLLRRQLQDQIDKAYQTKDLDTLKECAELLAESYMQARVAAKWLGKEAAQNLGTLGRPDLDQ